MIRIDKRKIQDFSKAGQAATELAVFGAILIFLIGTIVRSAVGNSYSQNENFKAMRMAMLTSWQGTINPPGGVTNTTHNNAQVIFLEDRLSPDNGKYGDLDRTPFFASGSGEFTYNLEYPVDPNEVASNLPIMDVFVNGQHFPLTAGSYVGDFKVLPPTDADPECQQPDNSCQKNQCMRRRREWQGGHIQLSTFLTPTVASTATSTGNCVGSTGAAQRICQQSLNACTIFTDLSQAQIFSSISGGTQCAPNEIGIVDPNISDIASSSQWAAFESFYQAAFPNNSASDNNQYLNTILSIVQANAKGYPLFYTLVPNPSQSIPSQFSTSAPTCSAHPCKDNELSTDVALKDYWGAPINDGLGSSTNSHGVMQYDLLRNADYSSTTGVLSPKQFPNPGCTNCLRNYIAWQWAATAGTSSDMIGLDAANDVFPQYDIDGRLKQVIINAISQDSNGITHVAFQDPDGGDIDGNWDINSCGPKPGLQQNPQIFTFTKNGTYLEIKEGKLFNVQTGREVQSTNQRNTIDLVQRIIQMSNNTGRFCTQTSPPTLCTGSACANPNPVEVCVDESATSTNCNDTSTFPLTCYDTNPLVNKIFVRSRIEDRRGHSWLTETSGQLQVH